MASAAASRPPPPPPPPPPPTLQWLSPRVSFSLDDVAGVGHQSPAAKPSADFEFLLAGCSSVSMVPADELFSGGKLVHLHLAPPPPEPEATVTAPPAAEPKIPAAAAEPPPASVRRWRDLLRLRKQQAASPAANANPNPKTLRRLLRRSPKPPELEPSLSLPLLRDSDAEEPEKPDKATPTPTQQLPPKVRLSPAPARQAQPANPQPPPPAVAADSPRLNAAGKVVFNGLGRSSSSPSSLAGGGVRTSAGRHRSIERSYSAHVRVAPVLNVPVCSLRGSRKSVSVFGIDRLFSPASGAAAAASSVTSKKGKQVKKEVTAAQ